MAPEQDKPEEQTDKGGRGRLEEAEEAYVKGDSKKAAVLARLVVSEGSPEEKERAREILKNVSTDPVALWVAVACLVLIALLALLTLGR